MTITFTTSTHHPITTALIITVMADSCCVCSLGGRSSIVICKAVSADRSWIAASRWCWWGWNRTKPNVFSHKVCAGGDVGTLFLRRVRSSFVWSWTCPHCKGAQIVVWWLLNTLWWRPWWTQLTYWDLQGRERTWPSNWCVKVTVVRTIAYQ